MCFVYIKVNELEAEMSEFEYNFFVIIKYLLRVNSIKPVSYTHLDVYKRQVSYKTLYVICIVKYN